MWIGVETNYESEYEKYLKVNYITSFYLQHMILVEDTDAVLSTQSDKLRL